MRIAGNTARDLARSKRTRRSLPLESVAEIARTDGDPESETGAKRLVEALGQVVRTLPYRQRVALLQRKYEGLSYREVAATLGCTEQTARAHVYQAMTRVRRHLGRFGSGPDVRERS